jgi:spore germination protein YaaH
VWVEFVRRLGIALHAQGKLLSVTVPVGVSVSTSYGVYGWPDIIPSIDRLRLMTYDYSWNVPGPVSPVGWVQTAITYVKGLVVSLGRDPQMVQIGVPTYGRNWAAVVAGTCPTSVLQRTDPTMRLAVTLAASNGVTPVRHSSGEMTFSYEEQFSAGGVRLNAANTPVEARTDVAATQSNRPMPTPASATVVPLAAPDMSPSALATVRGSADDGALVPAQRLGVCRVRRTVFYPDEWTVVQRARMTLDAGLGGIAIWAHGYESPEMWPLLRALGNEYAV